MSCLYNHDQILEFVRKISLKSFEIYQNYLCALSHIEFTFHKLQLYLQRKLWKGKLLQANKQ